ncbi:hypothetical protein B296_00000957 [Ensete ventricosum]|uniref:Uncharacterized protein n=1 Tax=Ensete ventricosum TaxID=4639 RepID=A0A427AF43_ENSVE|nr:hypothetical protein B296_00000957 [Ensete ventricosum]
MSTHVGRSTPVQDIRFDYLKRRKVYGSIALKQLKAYDSIARSDRRPMRALSWVVEFVSSLISRVNGNRTNRTRSPQPTTICDRPPDELARESRTADAPTAPPATPAEYSHARLRSINRMTKLPFSSVSLTKRTNPFSLYSYHPRCCFGWEAAKQRPCHRGRRSRCIPPVLVVDADAPAAPPPTTCKEIRTKEENNRSAGQPRHRLAGQSTVGVSSHRLRVIGGGWFSPYHSLVTAGPTSAGQVNARGARDSLARSLTKKTGEPPPVGRSVDAVGAILRQGRSGSRKVGRCQLAAFLVGRGDTDRSWPDHRRPDRSAQGRRWQTCLCSQSQSCEQESRFNFIRLPPLSLLADLCSFHVHIASDGLCNINHTS